MSFGEVLEWMNRPLSKSGRSARASWVRIPPSPLRRKLPLYRVIFLYLVRWDSEVRKKKRTGAAFSFRTGREAESRPRKRTFEELRQS